MPDADPRTNAADLFRQAYQHQMAGDFRQAIDLYTRSIEIFPTAEAYTFRGWTYSFLGDYDRAIAECLEAIKVDAEFGNPYNDIGAYLISLGRYDEAIPWLEQAKSAKRYEPRHFPYFNLGRIYLAKGLIKRAREEFQQALEIEPRYTLARQAIESIRRMVN
jgi:tetratricopeptide (TPR) repeat protein